MRKSDRQLLSHCIETLLEVQAAIEAAPAERLVQSAPQYKADSLCLDTIPEAVLHAKLIDEYDGQIVLVSEERGAYNCDHLAGGRVVVFADPTDRSEPLAEFLRDRIAAATDSPSVTFGEILARADARDTWERRANCPAALSGACCSLAVVKDQAVAFSMLLNYITRQIVVACDRGVRIADTAALRTDVDGCGFDEAAAPVTFTAVAAGRTCVTYLDAESYRDHAGQTGLLDGALASVADNPGGPARVLYLSDLNPAAPAMVMANGEKIGEWIGWLAVVRASGRLTAYAVSPDAVAAREGILVAPSPPYSVLELREGQLRVNIEKLKWLPNPSRYREMIVVTHRDNTALQAEIESHNGRKLLG